MELCHNLVHTYIYAPLRYKNSLQAANARERRRMDRMNEAFIRLVQIQVEKDGKNMIRVFIP